MRTPIHHPLPPRRSAIALVAALALACGDDPVDPTPDAGGPDAGRPDASGPTETMLEAAAERGLGTLGTVVGAAGLRDLLSGPGTFTLFAPTDAAFAAIEAPSHPGLLANVLANHLLPFPNDARAVLAAGSLRNSAGLRLPVDPSVPSVGGAALGETDIFASNGILHVIEQVILPPTIPEFVSGSTETSTLAAVLAAADPSVAQALAVAGPITVFAPVNAAFSRVDAAALLADRAFLTEVLRFHVASSQFLRENLVDGLEITMANGQTLQVSQDLGGRPILTDGQSRTIRVEGQIRLRNGVVHLVDRVMLPARDAVDLVATLRRSNLNALANAVAAADLTDTLQGMGPFTVFAPSDAAFAALGAAAPTQADLLANVLLNHLSEGARTTQSLARTPVVPSLGGFDLLVDFRGDPPTVNGAGFGATTNERATNGVVHVVDRVLVPPTILAAGRTTEALSTLVRLLGQASEPVQNAVDVAGPITVFAPVNSAFAGFDLEALERDQGRLDELLTYHVLEGQRVANQLANGQVLRMANGLDVTVRIEGRDVSLVDEAGNVVPVVQADLRCRNGVVHLLGGVLSPQHLVEVAQINGLTGLLGAVDRAQLSTTLRTGGPFTLFAPSNDAFAALGLDLSVIRPEVVANVLLNHLVPGRQLAADVLGVSALRTVGNLELAVTSTPGFERIESAQFEVLDVDASNGVAHVIDTVLVPPTVLEVAGETPTLSALVTAVGRASPAVQQALAPRVIGGGGVPITVFAPLDSAFAAQMLDPSALDQAVLDDVLRHHVLPGQLVTESLPGSLRIRTFNQQFININRPASGPVTVTDAQGNVATVVAADIRTLNGVVHLIDRVLLPN